MPDGEGSTAYRRRGGRETFTWGEQIESISVGKGQPWPEAPVAPVVSQPPDGEQEAGGPGQMAAACHSGPLVSHGSSLGVPSSGVVIPMGPCWALKYGTPNPSWEAGHD